MTLSLAGPRRRARAGGAMRSMLKPAARAPGLILGVLLAAAAGAVLAAGEIMPPLPGAAAGTTESREPSSEHGSRLLRTLAKRPEPGVVLSEDTAPVFAAEGMPPGASAAPAGGRGGRVRRVVGAGDRARGVERIRLTIGASAEPRKSTLFIPVF